MNPCSFETEVFLNVRLMFDPERPHRGLGSNSKTLPEPKDVPRKNWFGRQPSFSSSGIAQAEEPEIQQMVTCL